MRPPNTVRIMTPIVIVLTLVLSSCASHDQPAIQPRGSFEQFEAAPPETAETESETRAEPAPETDAAPENPGFAQNELDELLRQAAWTNDLVLGERLISWGADVNQKDATEQSAYLVATSEGTGQWSVS